MGVVGAHSGAGAQHPAAASLHSPDPTQLSDDEQARLATVQAIVENHSLAIEGTEFRDTVTALSANRKKAPCSPPTFTASSRPCWRSS